MKKAPAASFYLAIVSLDAFAIQMIVTLWMFYQVRVMEMSPLQLVLAGTLSEITIFLFEVPTGIVADQYSRRLSSILGHALFGLSFLLQGFVRSVPVFMLLQVLYGVGNTFISGAFLAWLVDEVGQEASGDLLLRATQRRQGFGILGILAAVGAGTSLGPGAAISIGGGLYLLSALLMLLWMPETGFRPQLRGERSRARQMLDLFREGFSLIRGQIMLGLLAALYILWGLYSEAYDRLWPAHLLRGFDLPQLGPYTEIIWFGLLYGLAMLLGMVGAASLRRRVRVADLRALGQAVLWLHLLMVVALGSFALGASVWLLIAAKLILDAARQLLHPLTETWINAYVPTEVRATALSFYEQAHSLGEVVGGPPLGWVGNVFGLRAALTASTLLLSPAIPLVLALRRGEDRGRHRN